MNDDLFLDGLVDNCFAGRNAIRVSEAKALFMVLSRDDDLVWEISSNGCWERAHEICRMIARTGLPCLKVFAMSGQRLERGGRHMRTPKPPKSGPWTTWPMHVTPCVWLGDGEEPTLLVLDPAVLDGPAPTSEWLRMLGDPDALCSVHPPECFKPSHYDVTVDGVLELGGFLTDPDFTATSAGLAELVRGRKHLFRG